jgi:hypothetical protein
VRRDLPIHTQLVQTAHAALEIGLSLNEEKKPKQTSFLILLDAIDQEHLQKISRYLDDHDIEHHMFFEPDYDTGYTAICTEPLPLDKRKHFKKFNLWKI